MKLFNLLTIIILSNLFTSCNNEEKDIKKLFSIETSNNSTKYPFGKSVTFSISNKKQLKFGPVTYFINNKKIPDNSFTFNIGKLGSKEIKATFSYNDDIVILKKNIEILSDIKTKVLKFEIINEYPHDIKAYTQGLEFYKGELYESTGQRGKSSLRKINYKTGEIIQKINLEDKYFGEGITFFNNKIHQLTWQSNLGFIYNPDDFKKIKSFKYSESKEGWGICNDGENIYKSDGTEKIWTLNNKSLEEVDYIEIYTNTGKINSLNELEWINGRIYANIYQKNGIAIINPKNGAVEAVVNCNSLKSKVTQHKDLDVLNGIAYNPDTKTIFVTGKNWDKLFEIKILN